VTGGASGIGYSIADRLAQLGASVLVFDLDGEKAQAAAREVQDRHGGKAVGLQGSVTSAGDVAAALGRAEQELGPVDILVNNAGPRSPRSFARARLRGLRPRRSRWMGERTSGASTAIGTPCRRTSSR
jgi:NAD(P)-dependent dehydrogenase (short-subunit alcohol dehydrogenase family)